MLTRSIKKFIPPHLTFSFATGPSSSTYYQLLGVEKGATTEQIRQAYHKLN